MIPKLYIHCITANLAAPIASSDLHRSLVSTCRSHSLQPHTLSYSCTRYTFLNTVYWLHNIRSAFAVSQLHSQNFRLIIRCDQIDWKLVFSFTSVYIIIFLSPTTLPHLVHFYPCLHNLLWIIFFTCYKLFLLGYLPGTQPGAGLCLCLCNSG